MVLGDNMRTLHEIEFEIEMTQRAMSQIVIKQVSDDEHLKIYDKRLAALEKERLAKLSSGDGQL